MVIACCNTLTVFELGKEIFGVVVWLIGSAHERVTFSWQNEKLDFPDRGLAEPVGIRTPISD